MKKTGILFAAITIFILAVSVVFPKNLGEHTPIWDIKERFFGDEYGEVRSEYFISMRMKKYGMNNKTSYLFGMTMIFLE